MMHDREKSDLAIVALKPTNKAGQLAAELAEQGRGPRGTRARKAHTGHWTGIVCHRRWNAYDKAARQRKKEKFTALLHHISIDTCSGRRSSRSRAMPPPA
jgi:RNA-directed DNA polymerase